MDRRRGVFGEGLARVLGVLTQGKELVAEALGREGWLRIELDLEARRASSWCQIALDFSAVAKLSRPGREGLYLHPFTLTLSFEGRRVDEWSDVLSHHWSPLITENAAHQTQGQGAEKLHLSGRLALLDIHAPTGGVLEVHFRLPWRDRDKREGFEADSQLDRAVLRVSTLSRARRLLCPPGLERAVIGQPSDP